MAEARHLPSARWSGKAPAMSPTSLHTRRGLALLFLLSSVAAPPLAAAPVADNDADILVTAQRRSERLDRVPLAVTAIGADRLAREDYRNLDRLAATVPNLYLNRNFGTSSGALVFLRGVGEGDSIFTNDPPVGIYVDDVIFPRATGSMFELLDVERVEVLRGPQGVLYGRNTSGGAIKLVTRRPEPGRNTAMLELATGSFARRDGRAIVNLSLGDRAALRGALLVRQHDGWGRNLTNGARVNDQRLATGRLSLLVEPDALTSILLTADLTGEGSTPRFPQPFLVDPANPARRLPRFRAPEGSIDRFTSADTDPLNDLDTGGVTLRVEHRLGAATLLSVTGYRALANRIGFDQTAVAPPAPNVILLQDQRQRSFSQELQLQGPIGGQIDYTAGLFAFAEHNRQLTAVSFAAPAGTPGARFRTDDFFVAPSRAAGLGNWSPYLPRLSTRSLSGFGALTWRPMPRLGLSAGARLTHERKVYRVAFLTAPDTVLVLPDGRRAERRIADSWTDVSPRLAAEYRLGAGGEAGIAYASVAKGFRSGSFDGRARNIDFVLNRQGAIAPETVWSYEAGLKTSFFNRVLALNLALFRNDYTNIAFSAARAGSNPPEIFRQNVGDARIEGVEAEASLNLPHGFAASGFVSTLSDRFTRLASSPGCTAFVADERQLDLRFTPDRRYGVRGGWSGALGRAGRLTVGGEMSGASAYFTALCNEPQHRVDNARTVNAQIGFDSRDGRWGVTLSATNLGNRRFNGGSVGTIGWPVEPRQWILSARRQF